MKFIKVPVKFNIATEEDMRKFEVANMSLPEEYIEDGYIHINPDQIVSFNEDSNGNINLTTSDGNSHMVYITYEEFIDIMKNEL